jgi:class 3 adenylate cyclase
MLKRARNLDVPAEDCPTDTSNELGELAGSFDDMANRLRDQTAEIQRKDAEIESLLLTMLTRPAMERFRNGGNRAVDHIQQLTLVAMHIEGIAGAIETRGAESVSQALGDWAFQLEEKAERAEIERVNCSGDRYLYACGLSRPLIPHVRRGVDFARDAMRSFREATQKAELPLRLRIGVESGSASVAVLGKRQFHQDVWGRASEEVWRLADAAPPNGILAGGEVHTRVADVFSFTSSDTAGAWLLREVDTTRS